MKTLARVPDKMSATPPRVEVGFKPGASVADVTVWRRLEERLTRPAVERRLVLVGAPEKTVEELEAEAIRAEGCGEL